MANKRIPKRRKKRKQKVTHSTSHAPLCALGEVLKEKALFEEIHQTVEIDQKTLAYRLIDKLVFAMLGIIAGAETLSEINTVLRPYGALLLSFGYAKCADQSVIQQTINAATPETVCQLEQAVDGIWEPHHLTPSPLSPLTESTPTLIDIDLSALPVSKRAEGATKGYVPKRKNQSPTWTRADSKNAGNCYPIPLHRKHPVSGGVQRNDCQNGSHLKTGHKSQTAADSIAT